MENFPKSVLKNPKAGRRSDVSSFISPGAEMQAALRTYNESVSEAQQIQLGCSSKAFSHALGRATEQAIDDSEFAKFMEKYTLQEIKGRVRRGVYNKELDYGKNI